MSKVHYTPRVHPSDAVEVWSGYRKLCSTFSTRLPVRVTREPRLVTCQSCLRRLANNAARRG